MKRLIPFVFSLIIVSILGVSQSNIQAQQNRLLRFNFEGNLKSKNAEFEGKTYQFSKGIDGLSLSMQANSLALNNLFIDGSKDFSLQFWVQTFSDKPTVLLSQKQFLDKSIRSQKNKGWVLYTSGGTFAWSIGSGDRRLNYERANGNKMPLCDGQWHQITMTYSKQRSEVHLYYDGHNKAIYKVGFDFTNKHPLVIGSKENTFDYSTQLLPQIENGILKLQALVDAFTNLGIGSLKDDEFLSLIVDPDELISMKNKGFNLDDSTLINLKNIRRELLKNQYTVFQNLNLTQLKPISKIYYLDHGKIKIHQEIAELFSQQTQLFPSEFNMDNLSIWDKVLAADEVLNSYTDYRESTAFKFEESKKTINIGDWNIWHGGIHFNLKDHQWDSRMRIVEMIKAKDLDVVLLQETYSSGDFIAAELGYYFATTTDWDYCFQGSNISVISRYPIKEISVPLEAAFMNVGVKLAISETQEIYAMSNWYGMNSFPIVYDFHKERFDQSDAIPILFGGDFNAAPHTDGGDSPASVKLLGNGFVDAYRSLHPDVKKYPSYTHMEGVRIDQIYYKGKGLKNTFTEVISKWETGFPSDHFLIVSKFELDY